MFDIFSEPEADSICSACQSRIASAAKIDVDDFLAGLILEDQGLLTDVLGLQSQFPHGRIEPLHLLAAILVEESSDGVKLLQGSGITRERF